MANLHLSDSPAFRLSSAAAAVAAALGVLASPVHAQTASTATAEAALDSVTVTGNWLDGDMSSAEKVLEHPGARTIVERERLLHGNWKIRPAAGLYFRRSDATIIRTRPTNIVSLVRKWDLAATEPAETNPDPDWTAGVLMAKLTSGRYAILDVIRVRVRANKVRELVKRTAENDGKAVRVGISQDPGQAGKEQATSYAAMLAGYTVVIVNESGAGNKVTKAEPLAAQWQVGMTPTFLVIKDGKLVSSTTGWSSKWGLQLRPWWASL